MKQSRYSISSAICALMMQPPAHAQQALPSPATTPTSPAVPQAHRDAPNIVIVMLDDVGFGASSTFGGPISTPALEALASQGLRYSRFHTAAICSATRAALLTGRNQHRVGMGGVTNASDTRPGYNARLPEGISTLPELLRRAGYNTALFGKWHLVPDSELTQAGPFDRWPTNKGFEKFYGILGGETDEFDPTLTDGTNPVLRPAGKDYHLSEDLAGRAISWVRQQHSLAPDKPFFLYFAPTATHAPIQVPRGWADRYAGQFDQGWDRMREETFARQKKLGIIPPDTGLTARPAGLPAWSSLTPLQKRTASRLMELYAGYLSHIDAQVGKIVQDLKERGQFDNTLFFYIVGDNGASGESPIYGASSYWAQRMGLGGNPDTMLDRVNSPKGGDSPHYPPAWAWAMNTPLQYTKVIASHLGGTRNGMVITWPDQIKDKGGLRTQYAYATDIMPTVLEEAGITAPDVLNGVQQPTLDGISIAYSFADPRAASRRTTQIYETYGNRAIYHAGWLASAFHNSMWQMELRNRPFADDKWELYNLDRDFSQAHDLAKQESKRLAVMKALFEQEGLRNQVLPLKPSLDPSVLPTNQRADSTAVRYYPGTFGVSDRNIPRLYGRSWSVTASLNVTDAASGAIVADGGREAGWVMTIENNVPAFTYRLYEAETLRLRAKSPLSPGEHRIALRYDQDDAASGKSANLTLVVDDKTVDEGRMSRTVTVGETAGFFSQGGVETFDVGVDSGSPVKDYPAGSGVGFPFTGGDIHYVDLKAGSSK